MTTSPCDFARAFGVEFPGAAIELSLPRLRFELAKPGSADPLPGALSRCRELFRRCFRAADNVCVELRFYGPARGDDPLTALGRAGLEPCPGRGWERRRAAAHEGAEAPTEDRYVAAVPVDSPGLDTLFRSIIWADHGGWHGGVHAAALFYSETLGVGFWPYDDRGADVFAQRKEPLIPLYHELSDWLLEYDLDRMRRSLGLA